MVGVRLEHITGSERSQTRRTERCLNDCIYVSHPEQLQRQRQAVDEGSPGAMGDTGE